MYAERMLLETDHLGNLKHVPKLPSNVQVEAIFLIANEPSETTNTSRRSPHPDIAGKIEIYGDIFDSVPESSWNFADDRA